MKPANLELEDKTERLVEMMEAEGLDGVLINAQHNFSWLTCGGSNGIDLSQGNGAGFLFVTRNADRYLIANNIEMPRLSAEELPEYAEVKSIEITWQAEKDPQSVIKAMRSVSGGSNFGSDIGFPETRWIEPSIAACRFELTSDEQERYRKLGRDAGLAVQNVVPKLQPGQTEGEVARIVRDELAAFGIYSVVTLIAGDERVAKYRHPVPTDNVWRNTIMIVVCARRQGLIASLTRIVCAGEPSSELQRRTEACAAVNAALYNATIPGATGAELYRTALAAYIDQGFPDEINNHHQGGAAGYRTRDWVAHPESQDIVRPNQAFAWNPSITGTKTEDTGVLTADGFEVITTSPTFPQIVTTIAGTEYRSAGVLEI